MARKKPTPKAHDQRLVTDQIVVRPLARADIKKTFRFFHKINPAIAERFVETIRGAIETLASMPESGALHHFHDQRESDIRHWPVKRFRKYLIFYRPLINNEGIEVIRVLHTARDIQAVFDEL